MSVHPCGTPAGMMMMSPVFTTFLTTSAPTAGPLHDGPFRTLVTSLSGGDFDHLDRAIDARRCIDGLHLFVGDIGRRRWFHARLRNNQGRSDRCEGQDREKYLLHECSPLSTGYYSLTSRSRNDIEMLGGVATRDRDSRDAFVAAREP